MIRFHLSNVFNLTNGYWAPTVGQAQYQAVGYRLNKELSLSPELNTRETLNWEHASSTMGNYSPHVVLTLFESWAYAT